MPDLTRTRQIAAPPEVVWRVLDDFGDIQRWSPGIKRSTLTSTGPVGLGSTRHCAFRPVGSAGERIEQYQPGRRMTVRLYDFSGMPFTDAVADFTLAAHPAGTEVQLHYRYTPNRFGRLFARAIHGGLTAGLGQLLAGLQQECERLAVEGAGP